MPSSEYSHAIGGGLKLKGAKDSNIKKKKKKPTNPSSSSSALIPTTSNPTESQTASEAPNPSGQEDGALSAIQKALADEERSDFHNGETAASSKGEREAEVKQYGKTEAQRRWEERRRKRLDERLKREGIKTHKQRVEELNKYLSKLSEHHDMPRIGPG